MPKRFILAVVLCFLASIMRPTVCSSADYVDAQKAAHVKAAYLYHLTRLSEWPHEKLSGSADTLHICVVGDDPHNLSGFFSDQVPRLQAGKHPIAIKHFQNSEELMDYCKNSSNNILACHVLFFTESETKTFEDCLGIVQGLPVLTASEIDSFPYTGGMVGFVIDGDRVRIKVNQEAVSEASLKISAEFLQHVEIVNKLDKPGSEG